MPNPKQFKGKSQKSEDKKRSVVEALVPKPSDSYRDVRGLGTASYYSGGGKSNWVSTQVQRAENDPYSGYAVDPLSSVNMGYEKPSAVKSPAQLLVDAATGGLSSAERDAAASRTKAAEAYQDEQTALLNAAHEKQRQENAERDKRERETAAKERQAAWSHNWNDERLAATRAAQEEAAKRGEGLGADEQRDEQRAMREAAKPAETPATPFRSDKPAPGVSPSYASFMDDDDDGEDEDPSAPTAESVPDIGGISADDQRAEQRAMRGAANEAQESEIAAGAGIPAEDRDAETKRLREEQAKLREAYNELNNRFLWGKIGVDYTQEDVERLTEMEAQLRGYDDQIAALWKDVTFGDRVSSTLSGAAEQYGAGVTDAERALYEATQGMRDTQNAEYLAEAQHNLERAEADFEAAKEMYANGEISKAELDEWERQRNEAQDRVDAFSGVGEAQRGATEATAALADEIATKAQQDLDNAKAGLSEFGQGAVDVFSNMTQMGMDAITGLATGGGSLFAMGVRTFGSGTQEARQAGADLDDQLLYGLATTAIELGTEKLFGGDAGIYGPGGLDGMAEGVIARLAQSDTGMIALRVLANAHQEGLEEVVSGLLDPFAKGIYDDQSIKKWLDEGWPLEELMYEYIIGAACGAIFDAGNNLTPGGHAAALEQNEQTRAAYEAQRNAPADPAQVLAEQATGAQPAEGLTAAEQRAEQMQQRQQTPDEILADAATPKPEEGKRNTTGEERAEGQAPEVTEKGEEEQPQPEKEEEAPAEEQPKPEPRTPDEILADEAAPKGERAESPSEAVESTQAEDHESVPESTQESTSEAPDELNNEPTATDYNEAQVEALEADFEADPVNVQRFQDGQGTYGQYSVQERLEVLQRLFPDADYYISEGNIVKGRTYDTTTGQSEAFGDRRTGSNHAAPKRKTSPNSNIKGPSAQQNTFDPQTVKAGDRLTHNTWGDVTVVDVQNGRVTVEMPDGELKTVLQSSMGDKFTPVQNAQGSGTIDEKNQTGRSEHHTAARSVEEANRALKEIERFKQNPEYRGGSYSNAEDAQAAVDKTISDLRNAGLTNSEELRNQAQKLRDHSKEAQRMVDRIEANTPEGEDIADPEYNYWYDEVDAAEDEAYAVDAIADFVEAHPEVFTETPSGGTMKTDESKGGSEREQVDSGGDRSDSPVDGDAGEDAEDSRTERKDDARRAGEMVGGKPAKNLESQADYDAAKDKRDQVNRRFDRGQAVVESEITLDGGEVIDIKYAPGWVKRAVEKAQKEAPDCRFIIATKTSSIAYYSHGNGVIVINPGRLANWALSITQKTGVPHSAANAVLHERVHYWLERSEYKASEIFRHIQSDFVNDTEAQVALQDAYDAHKLDYHSDIASDSSDVTEMQNALWEEVIADLAADLPRAFVKDGKINPAYERIKASANKYIQNYVVPSYRVNNGLDIYNGKPASGGPDAPSNPNDPGANKSWADSLTAQEAPPENTEVEQPGDDMTPLNDISREQDEERREKQKAETKKHFGTENHNRMTKALEGFEKWRDSYNERYGKESRDEHGGIIKDEDGNTTKTSALDDFAKNLRMTLEGEQTVQSFQEYYESLRSEEGESNATDENYLYDCPLAEALNQFANAERDLIYAEKGGPANAEKAVQYGEGMSKEVAKENFDKQSEAFSRVLSTRMEHLERNFKAKTEFNNEITQNSKGEKSGLKNALSRISKRFWQTQMRPDTFFKALVNFSGKAEVANELSKRTGDSEKKTINVRYGAREFFRDLTTNPKTSKAWADIESGKTKGNVDVPGLGKVSLNYELAILKTLETNGALDHIARFGAQFVNEADYIKGLNNNGMGETEGYQAQNRLTREALDAMARENLQAANERSGGKSKITGKDIYNEKIRILKELRSNLKSEVFSNDVARAAYDASVDAMRYLADEINGVTLRMYGLAKALQGSNYWPMQVIGRKNNLQFVNNTAFQMEDASWLQHRKGGSGMLQINPFAEVMSSYIDRSSKFVGFGELNSDLMMMSKEIGVGHGEHDAEKQSIQSVIQKQAGKSVAEWMTRYMETLNGTAKKPSKVGSWLRSNLASSSLSLNPGVTLKQSPSYFNAAGVVDLDILVKNRLVNFGPFRTAKSYEENALLQEINKRTSVLESRKSGTVVLGEQDGRALFGKLKKALPDWITNRDVSTVSNLALACAEQVKRNNPGIDTKSEEFYQKTAELLEEATIKTQPIYDAEFRPDYLRSSNELTRMLSMFRTQQSQNLNSIMQAFGEAEAAKREGGDVKAAVAKRNQVVAGYAISQVAFSVLSSAARLLTHKTKDYEDEDGQFNFGKLAGRMGLDFLTTAGGVIWFDDVVSKAAIDIVSNLATGGKGTSEFYSMSDNTISVVDDIIASTINVFRNPTPKTIKNEAFNLAQGVGLPARNAYNILNSVLMYAYDGKHSNFGNYDDIVDMAQTQGKMSDSSRAKQTTEAAVRAFGKGDRKRAEALLASLDYSDKDVVTAAKKAAGDAYVAGDIDEMTYRGILRNFAKVEYSKIDGIVHEKELDRVISALVQEDPKTYSGVSDQIKEAKEAVKEGESKSAAAAQIILDAAMSKEGQAAFLEKYTTSDYFKAYEAIVNPRRPDLAVDFLLGVDKNGNDSFSQDELYNYYLENGSSEKLIKAIWDANGFSKTWDQYKAGKKTEYDKLALENGETYQFGSAEKQLKDLQGDARLSMQKADADPAMFKVISGMKLSDKDTDTVVDRYVSSSNRANYHVLRDAGLKPSECFDMIIGIDENGKGTVSQKEMWAYYKAHPDQEKYIELLFNSQGYTSKGQPKTWKTFKKSQK